MAVTVEQAERIAQRVWRNASRLPDRADRVDAIKRAANLVALAQARNESREREPDGAVAT